MRRTGFKKPTHKRCKICKNKFEIPANKPFAEFCSDTCQEAAFIKAMDKLRANQERARKKAVKEHNERARHDINKIKEKHKTVGYYIQKLQPIFNKYIRLRDYYEPCISCGATSGVQWSAGHFFTQGDAKFLRVHEDNCHKQCWYNCNKMKSGNITAYRPNLIKKIGQERFDFLEANQKREWKPSIPELIEKIEHYTKLCEDLEMRIENPE